MLKERLQNHWHAKGHQPKKGKQNKTKARPFNYTLKKPSSLIKSFT
jgi:hypothetical protein